MKKHTPGPWQLNFDPNLKQIEIFAPNKVGGYFQSRRIAIVPNRLVNTTTDEKNATLLAAAPEMLSALKEVFREMDLRSPSQFECFDKVRAAIEKAEGK